MKGQTALKETTSVENTHVRVAEAWVTPSRTGKRAASATRGSNQGRREQDSGVGAFKIKQEVHERRQVLKATQCLAWLHCMCWVQKENIKERANHNIKHGGR